MDYHYHSCGHLGPAKYMGRGKARERRIASHFNRKCNNCLALQLTRNATRLTNIQGELLPGWKRAEALLRWARKANLPL